MTPAQRDRLLFGTNSHALNRGLSIYRVREPGLPTHRLDFRASANFLAPVELTGIEDFLDRDEELAPPVRALLADAAETARAHAVSVARVGVLFSHRALVDDMRPHVHRHAYADEVRPCLSIHYRLSGEGPSYFEYYDPVALETVRALDLCDNDAILRFCAGRERRRLPMPATKNLVLFDSATTPHRAVHGDALEAYVIYDNVVLREPRPVAEPVLL